MFFIVNKTQGQIVIGDLNLSLGPRQAIDLDKRFNRNQTETSQQLKRLIDTRSIEVKVKDSSVVLVPDTKAPEPIVAISPTSSEIDIQKLKEDLMKEITAGLNAFGKDIKDSISQQSPVTIIQQTSQQQTYEPQGVTVNDVVLTDIHARAVDKITKDSTGSNVNYTEERVKDNQVDNNVSELEDMLG